VVSITEAPFLTVEVPSLSTPGKTYLMGLLPRHGWAHLDGNCPARVDVCRHQRKAEEMTTSLAVIDSTTGELVEQKPLLVAYDTRAIAKGVAPDVAAKWAYDLGSGGKGVGIEGAQEAQRMLASFGEVIQIDEVDLDPRMEQTAKMSYWYAKATRWILDPEDPTKRVFAGNTICHRSQSKVEQHSDDWMRRHNAPESEREYENPHWYTIGSAKAARNAILDLAPANVRTAIREAGLEAARRLKSGYRPQEEERQGTRVQAKPAAPAAPQDALPNDPPPSTVTDEQRATIQGCVQSLVDAQVPFGPIKAEAADKWPYAAVDGVFQYGQLRGDDVQAFIELLAAKMPLEQ
jgi:hypothetical protein